MSRFGKLAWAASAFTLIVLVSIRYIIGGWVDLLAIPLFLLLLFSFVAVMIDIKFYANFLTLKTTKHGMNMGVSLLLAVVAAIAVNYFSVRYDYKLDWSQEKLNSLSPQTQKVLRGIDSEMKVFVFYEGIKFKPAKDSIVDLLRLYSQESSFIKVRSVDAYVDKILTQQYLSEIRNPANPLVLVEYKDKRIQVVQPYTEVQISSAIIRATRKATKKLYFVMGHGERATDGQEESSISDLVEGLKQTSIDVREINLLEGGGQVPEDADALAIVGPQRSFFPDEIQSILNYARSGGKIFIAADPGVGHTVPLITRVFGIEYKNNFILNDRINIAGRGAASSLGFEYGTENQITESFANQKDVSLFDLVSVVQKAMDAPKNLSFDELVFSPPSSYVVNDLKYANHPGDRGTFSMGIVVSGALTGEEKIVDGKKKYSDSNIGGEKAKRFSAVVFGDSDFLTNNVLLQGVNRDLAMNAFSYLLKEEDLISLRPRKPAGTQLVITSISHFFIVSIGVFIPLFFMILSLVLWFKRRGD
ncbi:MAG: GldG family protein [Bdellovibrionales bacterium]|nr:GldG family protein [Bdellovibrionales bacterium]